MIRVYREGLALKGDRTTVRKKMFVEQFQAAAWETLSGELP